MPRAGKASKPSGLGATRGSSSPLRKPVSPSSRSRPSLRKALSTHSLSDIVDGWQYTGWRSLSEFPLFQLVKLASLGEGGRVTITPEWSPLRRVLHVMLLSNLFSIFMALVIVVNMVLVMIEADRRAQCDMGVTPCHANKPDVKIPSRICAAIYIAEVVIRLFVDRAEFFNSCWNVLDSFIVIISVLGEIFDSLFRNSILFRLVRALKIVRALRLLTMFQELYLMIAGMASTMRTIFWACVMLLIVISLLSLMAIEILQPVQQAIWKDKFASGEDYDCDRCPRAFESVGACMITLFAALIMGDGIADIFVPLIERDFAAGVFILLSVAVVYLGFSNLILSVIVDKGNEARCQDSKYQLLAHRKMRRAAVRELVTLWQEIDTHDSDTISAIELQEYWMTNEVFKSYFKSMDMDMEFLKYALATMDNDGDGRVSFQEFADSVVQIKSIDTSPTVSFLKHQVAEVLNALSSVKQQVGCIYDKVQRPDPEPVPEPAPSAVSKEVANKPSEDTSLRSVMASRGPGDGGKHEPSAEDLTELLKYAYERPLPLNVPHLHGLGRNFADTCQRVEVQLGRLLSQVTEEEDEEAMRLELFACATRLVAAVNKALPMMLPVTPCGRNDVNTNSRNSRWKKNLRSENSQQAEQPQLHNLKTDGGANNFANTRNPKSSPRRTHPLPGIAKSSGDIARSALETSNKNLNLRAFTEL